MADDTPKKPPKPPESLQAKTRDLLVDVVGEAQEAKALLVESHTLLTQWLEELEDYYLQYIAVYTTLHGKPPE